METSSIREEARFHLQGRWCIAILVTFLASVLGGLILNGGSANFDFDEDTLRRLPEVVRSYLLIAASFGATLGVIQFVIGGTIRLGYCKFLLNLHDGGNADIKDLFSQFPRFAEAFLLSLLSAIYTFLWTLLFIIPGIVATYKYAMAPFILLENPGLSAKDAITESKEMMRGHKMDLFCLQLSFIGWAILSALTLGIGNFWLNPYMNMSYAVFYRRLQEPVYPVSEPVIDPSMI